LVDLLTTSWMRGVKKREQQGGEEEVTKIGKTEKSAAGLHVFVLHFFCR
jgi:hypothetical protein